MKQDTVAAIIQARLGSTRLPGKSLKTIGGKSMLEILIGRLRHSSQIDTIVVATTERPQDDEIAAVARGSGVAVYRGSENDVLARYIGAAQSVNSSVVVRVTGDNPLTDPVLTDALVLAHRDSGADYTYCPRAPRGLSVEVVNRAALEKTASITKAPQYREHVTYYILDQPESWKIHEVPADELGLDFPDLRLTVDTTPDIELVEKLYSDLGDFENLDAREVVDYIKSHPEIRAINAGVEQFIPESGKKVSIIIRSYNQENFLRQAVDSAINQTLPVDLYEVLVIEDGSTDSSPEILKSYGNRIRLKAQPNQGPIRAINTGIASAKGEYIIFLDADDIFEADILKRMFDTLEEDKNVDFVYCDYYEKDMDTGETRLVSLEGNIFNSVGGGIMFRKAVLVAAGGYDDNLVFPEYDMLMKMTKLHRGTYIPLPLFTYRRHHGSITSDPAVVATGMRQLFERYGRIPGLRDY
jgi:spore coat polysaccharide biosynthesis protein SpsF